MLNGKQKYVMNKFGKKCYFLGQDKDGINYFLEEATWDCGWYWGGGYVETYSNNNNPVASSDIDSHQHFNGLFFKGRKNGFDNFKEFLVVNPFTDSEIWGICELMNSFYIAREYSDMLFCGGAHYTKNPTADSIKSEDEYRRINEKVIPSIMKELSKILESSESKGGRETWE